MRKSRAMSVVSLLIASALCAVASVSHAGAQREIPIHVALQPMTSPGSPAQGASAVWLQQLLNALQAPSKGTPTLRVVEHTMMPTVELGSDGILAGSEDLQPQALRRAAAQEGAAFLVIARMTHIALGTSIDIEILPVGSSDVLAHYTASGRDAQGVREALVEIAGRTRTALWTAGDTRHADAPPATAVEAAVEPAAAAPGAVRAIRIEGNRRIDEDAIRAVIGTQEGNALSSSQISNDVRRIYELGFFRDVQVLANPSPEGVEVVFSVDENPLIKEVAISGNDNVDGDDIKEKLTLTVGSTIDFPLVLENQQRIKAFYQSQGYYLAKINHTVETLEEGEVAVTFEVEEGEQLRLQEIDFVGNSYMDDDELMKGMQTKPWGWTSFASHFFDNSGMYAEPIFYQDLDAVQKKYMDEGFIRVQVAEPEVNFDEDGLWVKVRVNEGPQFRVGQINVAGDDSMDESQLRDSVALEPGEVFSRSTLSDDVERLRARYADRGFFSASVRPRTDVDPDTLTVDCMFEVEKGELYFVDSVDVAGNTRTRDDVVRRELGVVEGELYSAAEVERSKARVQRLGFFEEVTMETKQLDNNRVGVSVDVVERPTGSFSFGAGVGSSDGFLLNGSIRQDNLFGMGYGLNMNADLGSRNQRAGLRFSDPRFRGTVAALSTGFTYSSTEFKDFGNFDQTVSGFDLQFSYPLDAGETRAGTGYSLAFRELDAEQAFQSNSLLQREEFDGGSATSLVSVSLRRDTRDDIRFPTQGESSSVGFDVAGLGGLSKFIRLEARTTRYFPMQGLLGFESTFVFNTRVGYILPFNDVDDFDLPDCVSGDCLNFVNLNGGQVRALADIDDDLELPLSERYFLGGIGSAQVRGFEQRSLGPRRVILNQCRFSDGQVAFFPIGFQPAGGNVVAAAPTNDSDACATAASFSQNTVNGIDQDDVDDFDDLDLTEVIGGNKMMLANFELQFPISDDLGITGILFFDMGNAFAENEAFNPADLRFGTGVGGQWLSPFGPILVYLGVPLDRLEDEDGSVFEFTIGGSPL